MDFLKKYWKTLVFFSIVGLIGGFASGLYLLDSYPADIRQQLVEELQASGLGQIPVDLFVALITAVQSAGYGLVLGAIGIFLAKKVGLWKDERSITKKPLVITIIIATIGGLVMILSDILFFSHYSEVIAQSYSTKPTLVYILATVTYGAVIEEVMLRLFFMSAITFVLQKLFRKEGVATLIAANVICAMLFAAGHLPATIMMIGATPMIIFRCFLLNGSLGLLFGYLYRKFGFRYAMIAHGGCHVVSKLIWILFI